MKHTVLTAFFILMCTPVVRATTNQFLLDLNTQWTSQHASNVLSYLDAELSSRPDDPQVLFARGVAAAEMQLWARGATNYIWQAMNALNAATNYTFEEKAQLLAALTDHLNFFIATVDVLNEPTNSVPQTNITIQMEMFLTHPDKYPYFEFLSSFKEP